MQSGESDSRLGLNIILVAVFGWTVILAVGVRVALGSWLGAAIVCVCGFGFLGIWKLMLLLSDRSTNEEEGGGRSGGTPTSSVP